MAQTVMSGVWSPVERLTTGGDDRRRGERNDGPHQISPTFGFDFINGSKVTSDRRLEAFVRLARARQRLAR